MAMATFPYRVRAGALLPHHGDVLEGGALVQLTRQVAAEVRHLVEPLDDAGHVIAPPSDLQVEIDGRPAHERDGILLRKRAEWSAHLIELQAVAAQTKATADAAQTAVDDLAAAIAEIDGQLAAPATEPPADAPAAPPERKASKARPRAATESDESTSAPAAPADQTKE